jgi:nitrogenase molybdenum-cofactor synthesis protein NifE
MMKVIPGNTDIYDRYMPCMEIGAIMAATMIRNSLVVNHSPSGCSITATHFRSNNIPDGTYVPILHSAVQQSDLIQGGTEKLLKCILDAIKAGRYRNIEVIWILTGCATSMVQDDIYGVAKEVENKTGIRTIPIDTPGFQGGVAFGCDEIYSALIENFADKSRKPKKGKINIICPHLMGTRNMIDDTNEVIRLLKAADVDVNVVMTFNNELSDFENFFDAEANYFLTPEQFSNFEAICDDFKMKKYGFDSVLPVGVANTEEWYLSIAEKFGNVEKAKKILITDMNRIKKRIGIDYNATWVFHDVAGKKVGILGYVPFVVAMARYLFFDLNARPVVIGVWGETERAMEYANRMLSSMESYLDFELYENPTYYQYGEALIKKEVDFAIGQKNDKTLVEGLNIPHLSLGGYHFFNHNVFIPWPYFGILGNLHLLSEIGRVTEELKAEKGGWIARSFIRTNKECRVKFSEECSPF